MLVRTVTFFNLSEVAKRLQLGSRVTKRKLLEAGAVSWIIDGAPHWAEEEVVRIERSLSSKGHAKLGDQMIRTREAMDRLGVERKMLENMPSTSLRHDIVRVRGKSGWYYSAASIDRYLEKKKQVEAEGLKRSIDIARDLGVGYERIERAIKADIAHFPKPIVRLGGRNYFRPSEVAEYFNALKAFNDQYSVADLSRETNIKPMQLYKWIEKGYLPFVDSRAGQLRIPKSSWKRCVEVALKNKRRLLKG